MPLSLAKRLQMSSRASPGACACCRLRKAHRGYFAPQPCLDRSRDLVRI